MLAKFIKFVKKYQADIILVIGVILISLLSFAVGYITAKEQEKAPLKFEQTQNETKNSNYWSGNMRSLFGLEAFRKRA